MTSPLHVLCPADTSPAFSCSWRSARECRNEREAHVAAGPMLRDSLVAIASCVQLPNTTRRAREPSSPTRPDLQGGSSFRLRPFPHSPTRSRQNRIIGRQMSCLRSAPTCGCPVKPPRNGRYSVHNGTRKWTLGIHLSQFPRGTASHRTRASPARPAPSEPRQGRKAAAVGGRSGALRVACPFSFAFFADSRLHRERPAPPRV